MTTRKKILSVGKVGPRCYCGAHTVLRKGKFGEFYSCERYPDCDGMVGTHKRTGKPLGTPASRETREARKAAHEAFDPLWNELAAEYNIRPQGARSAAYRWLAVALGKKDPHMGRMEIEDCRAVIELCGRAEAHELLVHVYAEDHDADIETNGWSEMTFWKENLPW